MDRGGDGYPERRRHGQVARGTGDWVSNLQEVEAPRPLTVAQNDT